MSLPLGQHDNGLMPTDDPKEPMTLMDVLGGTSFVSATGRTYRLFGNEDKAFSLPAIPAIPPILTASKTAAVSLEEALQQIESFSQPSVPAPIVSEKVQPKPIVAPPTLQLFQALGESAPKKLVKKENTPPSVSLPAKGIIDEVSQSLAKRHEEKRTPLRVIFEHVEEPFIVPFTKPEPMPEEPVTKNVTLKIATEPEFALVIHCPKTLRKCQRHHRKGKATYRKPFSQPPAPVVVVDEPKPVIDVSTFQWSAQLDSLMQTAGNQIRMLTDHLIVQSNQGTKGICFKSIFPGDGCSTILLCAAKTLTERNYRVLLMDAHHRHVNLPERLNLSGNLDSGSEVIVLNKRLGLWVWQDSKTVEENRLALSEVITANQEKYDLILVDDGSVTESPLTEFVEFWGGAALDGVILISNTKRSAEMPVSHVASRFRQHHIPLIGITENYV